SDLFRRTADDRRAGGCRPAKIPRAPGGGRQLSTHRIRQGAQGPVAPGHPATTAGHASMNAVPLLEAVVAKRWVAALDIVALELAPVTGDALPAFSAGAHIDVEVLPGLMRQYSLCNDPGETHRYVIG